MDGEKRMDNDEVKCIINAIRKIADELEINPPKANQLISGKKFRKFIHYHNQMDLKEMPDPDVIPKFKCLDISLL